MQNDSWQEVNDPMSTWTDWRKIADRRSWYDDTLDWDGPACYELAIGGPRGGNLKIVYLGETSNEKTALSLTRRLVLILLKSLTGTFVKGGISSTVHRSRNRSRPP